MENNIPIHAQIYARVHFSNGLKLFGIPISYIPSSKRNKLDLHSLMV